MVPSKKAKRRAKARGPNDAGLSPVTTRWSLAFYRTAKGLAPARDEHDSQLYRVFKSVYDEALSYREDYSATRRIVLPMGIAKDRKQS